MLIFSSLCFVVGILIPTGLGLSCYQCVSTQPGCGAVLDWRWHWSYTCDDNNDKCIKIIERKGADEIITRSCLSTLEFSRHDIPADKYEGCRKATSDPKLAHYVNNTVKQLDIKRDYYDDVTWCFCEFDHFCNKSSLILPPVFWIVFLITVGTTIQFRSEMNYTVQ